MKLLLERIGAGKNAIALTVVLKKIGIAPSRNCEQKKLLAGRKRDPRQRLLSGLPNPQLLAPDLATIP